MKLQRWWKDVLLRKLKTKSAIVIQSYYRAWHARQRATKERLRIVVIQVSCLRFFIDMVQLRFSCINESE